MLFQWLFRKNKTKKPKCRHYKEAGYPALDNMEVVIEFDQYLKYASYSFSVNECTQCGHRAFGCMHLHCMRDADVKMIDSFIRREIHLSQFVAHLSENGFKYRIHEETKKTDERHELPNAANR